MDGWLKQEALKNADVKRLAHEAHTSSHESAHLPQCSAQVQAHIHVCPEPVRSATAQAGGDQPAGVRFCPGESRPPTLVLGAVLWAEVIADAS